MREIPYCRAAAVFSSINDNTFRPAMCAASLIASLSDTVKYDGTVSTASVTRPPENRSAFDFAWVKIMAIASSGDRLMSGSSAEPPPCTVKFAVPRAASSSTKNGRYWEASLSSAGCLVLLPKRRGTNAIACCGRREARVTASPPKRRSASSKPRIVSVLRLECTLVTIWNGEPGLTRATLKYIEPVSTPISCADAVVSPMKIMVASTSMRLNVIIVRSVSCIALVLCLRDILWEEKKAKLVVIGVQWCEKFIWLEHVAKIYFLIFKCNYDSPLCWQNIFTKVLLDWNWKQKVYIEEKGHGNGSGASRSVKWILHLFKQFTSSLVLVPTTSSITSISWEDRYVRKWGEM